MKDNFGFSNYNDEAYLALVNIGKKYNSRTGFVVRNVSFECKAGEIVGLLGGNGAGKSTTLKCITGMLKPTEGSVNICGFDTKKEPVKSKEKFSFVTDNHAVFEKLTGMQYLALMADIYSVPSDLRAPRIQELQNIFALGKSVNNLISTYSHGMKQKICMMGSLIHKPKVWILDEPMIGLDPSSQVSVLKFMRFYADCGNIILFSSHNVELVEKACSRKLYIENGTLTEKNRTHFDSVKKMVIDYRAKRNRFSR